MIRIGYNGVTFRKSDAIRYAYRLVESDTNWTISQDPYALFTALNSGSYTFEVKALGAFPGAGVGSEKYPTPDCATPLGKVVVSTGQFALVVILIILLVFRQNTRRTKHPSAINGRIKRLKTTGIGWTNNPHFYLQRP